MSKRLFSLYFHLLFVLFPGPEPPGFFAVLTFFPIFLIRNLYKLLFRSPANRAAPVVRKASTRVPGEIPLSGSPFSSSYSKALQTEHIHLAITSNHSACSRRPLLLKYKKMRVANNRSHNIRIAKPQHPKPILL